MKATSSQLYMATINLIGTLYSDKEEIEDIHIAKALKIATRTAAMIDDEENELPKDEEIGNCIRTIFRDLFGKNPISKSQLINAVILYGKHNKKVAEYIVNRAEVLGIIIDDKSGFRSHYSLA